MYKHLLGALVVLLIIFWAVNSTIQKKDADTLTIFCAHDRIYAEQMINSFSEETGIPIIVRYDSECTKSLGLTELIINHNQNQPACDIFWNNELMGTLDLLDANALHPYQGTGFARMPNTVKDPTGHWVGFAGRLRCYIINTNQMITSSSAITNYLSSPNLSKAVIAKPLFGTTRTHYTIAWQNLGEDKLKKWHHNMHSCGVREVNGNAMSKNLVALGKCKIGFTDSDDFFVAKDAKQPVAILPIILAGKSICIPNTVAIIKGTSKLENAKIFVDWLLSKKSELRLANSRSRQIPLGNDIEISDLPKEMKQLYDWAKNCHDLNNLNQVRKECLQWLKSIYIK